LFKILFFVGLFSSLIFSLSTQEQAEYTQYMNNSLKDKDVLFYEIPQNNIKDTTLSKTLQSNLKSMIKEMRQELDAKGVLAVVMDSRNGHIIAMVDTNSVFENAYPLNRHIRFTYEPGSVMMPIVFSTLLEKKLVDPCELVNGHKGSYEIVEGKNITDEHKFDWLSAENVIVLSSNIGISQLAQKLSPEEYYYGLRSFGFSRVASNDFNDENLGYIPRAPRLENPIYKATTAYGYGMKVNLLQLVKAYNVFNNGGVMLEPIISPYPQGGETESEKVLSVDAAETMKKILIKTVDSGTGQNTKIDSLEIGGKTGTAHIVENGMYVNKYNTSFLGFANDQNHKWLGCRVDRPV